MTNLPGRIVPRPLETLDIFALPPSPRQRSAALAWAGIVASVFLVAIPFAGRSLPHIEQLQVAAAAILAGIASCMLVTAFLLWRQFVHQGRLTLAMLGLAYYCTALLTLGQIVALPVPDATHAIGGPQAVGWFWLARHASFSLLILILFVMRPHGLRTSPGQARALTTELAVAGGAFVIAIVTAIVAFGDQLPIIMSATSYAPLYLQFAFAEWLLCIAALGVFVRGTELKSVIHIWLAVAIFAFLADISMRLVSPVRNSVGAWVALLESLISASVVLVVLLRESGRLTEVVDEQRTWLTSVIENVADALVIFGPDKIITSCNEAASRMLRRPRENVIGSPITEWFPQMEFDTAKQLADGCRADGSRFPAEVAASIVGGASETTIVVARDVTERRRAEQAAEEIRDQALRSAKEKSEMLATMSHEIRTPVNAIIGMTELLLDTPMSDQQRDYAHRVQGAADALLAIIDDILDLSKLEAGKLELDEVAFDPLIVVEQSADLVTTQARKKNLALSCFVDPAVPRALWGDANRVRQILLNLASNAVKFTERGQVTIRATVARDDEVSVTLRFEVVDTGIGIPAATQARLFAPFTQADRSTSRRYGGTGLGLSISRRLALLMHGTLNVRSKEGEGSTFWMDIPFSRYSHGRAEQSHLAGLRALVVEADAGTRETLRQYLQAWEIDVEVAATSDSTLELLREAMANGQKFDVAVIDCGADKANGVELGRSIAQDPGLNGVRTLLLTSEELGSAQNAGEFGSWVPKPVRQSLLFDALTESLRPDGKVTAAVAPVAPAAEGDLPKILLVEDNPANRTIVLQQLARLGIQADIAADGREAVDATERVGYGLVIMDCLMPEMDGFEATRRIREREGTAGKHVPIVAMTANAMEGDRESCLAAGMDDYLSKPVRLAQLRRLVERYTRVPLA